MFALSATEGGWWAAGDELIYGDSDGIRVPRAAGLEAEELISVAALDARRVVVGTRLAAYSGLATAARPLSPSTDGGAVASRPLLAASLLIAAHGCGCGLAERSTGATTSARVGEVHCFLLGGGGNH